MAHNLHQMKILVSWEEPFWNWNVVKFWSHLSDSAEFSKRFSVPHFIYHTQSWRNRTSSSGRAISLLFLITSQPETFQCSCRHRPETVRLNRDRASDGLWGMKVDRGTREISESSTTQRRNWLCYWTWHHHYWRGSSWPIGSRVWSPSETGHPSFKQSSLVTMHFFLPQTTSLWLIPGTTTAVSLYIYFEKKVVPKW